LDFAGDLFNSIIKKAKVDSRANQDGKHQINRLSREDRLDLFNDSDSFMQDLSENELDLLGGKAPIPTARLSIFCKHPLPVPTPPVIGLE
jgi:hypothetical protein